MKCKFNKRKGVSNLKVKVWDYIILLITFKYFDSITQNDRQIEDGDINYRIQVRWLK